LSMFFLSMVVSCRPACWLGGVYLLEGCTRKRREPGLLTAY
jgi:hypothetical protein